MTNNEKLKPGWTKVKFGEVVRLCKDRSPDPLADGLERYVGLEHIEPEDLRLLRWGLVADGITFTSRFKPGQVLFGKRRAYQRKVAVADFEGVCSGDIYVFESADPDQLLPEFLPFICQTNRFFEYVIGTSAGSLSPRTNWRSLKEYELSLPPINEQIVLTKKLIFIERAICSCRDAIQHSRLIIRSFLLKELPLVREQDSLWPVKKMEELIEVIDPNPSHRYPDYVEDGIPLVATQDFSGENDYCFDKCRRVSLEVFKEQDKRCRFSDEDVVFARKGILGVARMYGKSAKAFSHTVVILKPKSHHVLARYILWLCRSDSLMAEITQRMNSNSGVPTLGIKTIESLRIWSPPKKEQLRIVERLDAIDQSKENLKRRTQKHIMLKAHILTFEEESMWCK